MGHVISELMLRSTDAEMVWGQTHGAGEPLNDVWISRSSTLEGACRLMHKTHLFD